MGDLHELIFHAFGDVTATKPWCRDKDLGIEAPEALRMKRYVEMYQWEEHKSEHKDKDGKKHVTYTYTKKWSSHKESTRDNRNPSFPTFSAVLEAQALHMTIENRPKKSESDKKNIKLLLSPNFVKRIKD